MSKFKLVTIICEPVLSPNLIAMIRSMGATGFTVTDVRGEGSGDKRSGEIPSEKTKIEVVIGSESSDQIMARIAETYFQNYSLIVYATDIQVIRNKKF
jgi:nitrogen regulatory protein PII